MEKQVRLWLWLCSVFGLAVAGSIGLLARDMGLIQGALIAFVGGVLAAPVVAKMWKAPN